MIKITEITTPFMGLNRRAIVYLLQTGYWCEIEGLTNRSKGLSDNPLELLTGENIARISKSRYGILYSDLNGSIEQLIVCGLILDSAIIPTFVHDIYYYTSYDGSPAGLPLFSYVLSDQTYIHETVDDSVIAVNGRPALCLSNPDNVIAFKWTKSDIEEAIGYGYEIEVEEQC